MLEIRQVYKTFNPGTANEVRALRGVTLTVDPGSTVSVTPRSARTSFAVPGLNVL